MKNLTTSIKKIADIVKKNVYIASEMGHITHSSDASIEGTVIGSFDLSCCKLLDAGNKLYICIDNGSPEEIELVKLILQDELSEGTADNCQQFLINIVDGTDVPEEYYRRFNLPFDDRYRVYCISVPKGELFHDAYSLVSNSFYGDDNIWVFPYENDIILLEKSDNTLDRAGSNAEMIRDMANTEIYAHVYIGIGNAYEGILNIRQSFREAKEAIRIGRLYNLPREIFILKDLLAERIVSLIPRDRVEELAGNVLKGDINSVLDGEMIRTVETFFKSNLNVSDSSRILYIHRNTLLYRLDKLEKATGLDIRKFEDAVVFKLSYLLKLRRKA